MSLGRAAARPFSPLDLKDHHPMPVKELSDLNPDGTGLGQSASDKIRFYGATPVVRRTFTSIHNTLTDLSAGAQNYSTGIATITATFVSTVVANAIATLAAAVIEIQRTLRGNGLWPTS
jgi:hypothetical protein